MIATLAEIYGFIDNNLLYIKTGIIMAPLEIVALISTITGLNPVSILQLISKGDTDKDIGKQLLLLLDTVSRQNDPLIGYWTLGEWNYLKESPEGTLSSGWETSKGGLSIYFKYPNKLRWRGIMYLEYVSLRTSETWKSNLPESWLKRMGHKFFGLYDVEFIQEDDRFHGTSILKLRDPDNGKEYRGEFIEMSIEKGCIKGRYENYGKDKNSMKSVADPVIFIQKKRWAESMINFNGMI
jgi:hypothetical protein